MTQEEIEHKLLTYKLFLAGACITLVLALATIIGMNEALQEEQTTNACNQATITLLTAQLIEANNKALYDKEWRNKLCHKSTPNKHNLPPLKDMK